MINNKVILKFKLILLLFILLQFKQISAQDSQVIKKVIIEENLDDGRLLSPPTEKEKKIIKLIPPESILKKEVQKNEKLKEIQKRQEEKRKTLEEEKNKQIQKARELQEKKKE